MNRWKAYLLISSLFIISSFVAGGMSASGAAVAATHNAAQDETSIDFTAIPEGMRIMPPPPEVMGRRKLENQPLPDLSSRTAPALAPNNSPTHPVAISRCWSSRSISGDIPSLAPLPLFDTMIFAPPGCSPRLRITFMKYRMET